MSKVYEPIDVLRKAVAALREAVATGGYNDVRVAYGSIRCALHTDASNRKIMLCLVACIESLVEIEAEFHTESKQKAK